MKLMVKENRFPHVPPVSFMIELPDELGEKFDVDFLHSLHKKVYFNKLSTYLSDFLLFTFIRWKHVHSAYLDLYVLESEEAITRINARVWERKHALLDMFLEEEGRV